MQIQHQDFLTKTRDITVTPGTEVMYFIGIITHHNSQETSDKGQHKPSSFATDLVKWG